jgi:hypothetical protein
LLDSKLQKLQLSEELEKALIEEFGKFEDDPLLSSKFDINDYINSHFTDGTIFELITFRAISTKPRSQNTRI